MSNRKLILDPQWQYYRVLLQETIGIDAGAVHIDCWVRHIWAHTKPEAAQKAILFHLKKNPGSGPKIKAVEFESYSGPIRI